MMSLTHFKKSRVDPIPSLYKFHTTADVLRLDIIHPVISGNKWFKLKEYFKEAVYQKKKTVVTFGGAYSNHIVATAAAGKLHGLNTIGIIAGEKPASLSPSLRDALSFDMELIFISREDYKSKKIPDQIFRAYNNDDLYFINEGGYGDKGMLGAKDILAELDSIAYTHIMAATGTGTMLAGLIANAHRGQQVIGVSVLKNNFSLQKEIKALLLKEKQQPFDLLYDYHFGGYAKHNQLLFRFMNEWYVQNNIPSDFVYTGKLFFALNDLLEKSYFPKDSKVLVIHSGGLQGNRSLPSGTLIF